MKFLLDTNIISEIRKGERAHPSVANWVARTPVKEIGTSVLVLVEQRLRAEGDEDQADDARHRDAVGEEEAPDRRQPGGELQTRSLTASGANAPSCRRRRNLDDAVIPRLTDQNLYAQSSRPMDMILQGWSDLSDEAFAGVFDQPRQRSWRELEL